MCTNSCNYTKTLTPYIQPTRKLPQSNACPVRQATRVCARQGTVHTWADVPSRRHCRLHAATICGNQGQSQTCRQPLRFGMRMTTCREAIAGQSNMYCQVLFAFTGCPISPTRPAYLQAALCIVLGCDTQVLLHAAVPLGRHIIHCNAAIKQAALNFVSQDDVQWVRHLHEDKYKHSRWQR